MLVDALIGNSGFVGSSLLRQRTFGATYRSNSIHTIAGRSYGTIICAGAPAQKWLANREPAADAENIRSLIAHLSKVACEYFILVSTVDVFSQPIGVDEHTVVDPAGLRAYGRNRLHLETFIQEHFPQHLIVRLPGLVGPGLRKNVIFDLHNSNNLESVDARGTFQFYPIVNLAEDIRIAVNAGLKLIHLTSEPVSVAEIAWHGFNRSFTNALPDNPATYDFRSKYAALFGGVGHYQYSKRESVLAVRTYAQSEPRTAIAIGQGQQ